MKKISRAIYLFLFFFLLIETAVSQTGFSKVYYDGSIHAGTVAKTYDNAYVITGIKYNAYENIIIKTDTSGNLLWNKVIENSSSDIYPNIISLNDSNLLIVTNRYDEEHSLFSLLCLKINTYGETIWVKTIDMGKSITPYSVEQTVDSGFIITGVVGDDIAPIQRIAVLKLDQDGNLQWSKKMYAGNHSNYGYSAIQTADSAFIITGFIEDLNPFSSSAYLIKLSAVGEIIWSKIYHLESSNRSTGFDVLSLDNGFLMVLVDSYYLHVSKTDLTGSVLWAKQYPISPDLFLNLPTIKIQKTQDTAFIVLAPDGILKIDDHGNPIWSKSLEMYVADFVIAPDNGIFIVGNGPIFGVKEQKVDFPHIGVIKTDSFGNNTSSCIHDYGLVKATDTTIISDDVSFEVNENGFIETIGIEFSTSNILVDTGCVSFIGNTFKNQFENIISIFPNPTSGIVNILMKDSSLLSELEVYDALGTQVFHTSKINTTSLSFSLNSKQPGLYMIKLQYNNQIVFRKVLIY